MEIGEIRAAEAAHANGRGRPILRRGKQAAVGAVARMHRLLGRPAGLALPLTREAFFRRVDTRRSLEIGPFDNPVLRGDGVRYFDILGTEELKDRSRRHGRATSDVPAIDYVSPTGDLGIVPDRFATILSSHCIEHQPDLVRHLRSVEALLEPGGRYYVICPDKRYCFDYFNGASSYDAVVAAFREGRTVHTPEMVRAHIENTTHNDSLKHWLGRHGRPIVEDDASVVAVADDSAARVAAGEYVDVHGWMFTPETFLSTLRRLIADGLVGLEIVSVTQTRFGAQEFFAELRKPG